MSIDPHDWAKRAFDRHDLCFEKQVEAAIASGSQALRSAFLLNGAACIALLALLGSGNAPGETADWFETTFTFAAGALAAVVAMGVAYLTNTLYAESLAAMEQHWDHPYHRPTSISKWRYRCAVFFQWLAIILGFGSLGAFGVALWNALKVTASI